MTRLPHIHEATDKVNNGTASALDKLIYHEQPAGTAIVPFRNRLQAALDEQENEHQERLLVLRKELENDADATRMACLLSIAATVVLSVAWCLFGRW